MPTAFISYRRVDSKIFVEKLRTELCGALDNLEVFVDTGGIDPGEDFQKILRSHIEQDFMFLAVIGPRWIFGDGNHNRLQNPEDMIRREIEWRLKFKPNDIIPILIDRVPMPDANDLPKEMHGLLSLNALEISITDFATGFKKLVNRLRDIMTKNANELTELEEFENLASEGKLTLASVKPPGPSVPVFQLPGKWSCDVESLAAGPSTGITNHMLITFEVMKDKTMTGSLCWPGRKKIGQEVSAEIIEGEATLVLTENAGLDGGDRVKQVVLQGVRGRTRSLTIHIPVHQKFGKIYHGTDENGFQYTLRLLKPPTGRIGF